MTHEELHQWRRRMRLNQNRASRALRCKRRHLQRWEIGLSPIPRRIELACRFLEAVSKAVR